MAQFPPNLDDRELYLPYNIFLNQKIPTKFNPHHHLNLSYMDDLAPHVTALSLLRQTRPNPPLFTEWLMRPPVQTHVVNPLRPPNYYVCYGGLELESDRVVQRQHLNCLVQQNWVLPNQRNGFGFGFHGGLPRESRGTGVFHPHGLSTPLMPRRSRCQATSKLEAAFAFFTGVFWI
ncbi:hypothetical protein Q3G72_012528 [Acer saccharum]|nr:hypothetical protein Q3G72_012528 [Acer saccharum]